MVNLIGNIYINNPNSKEPRGFLRTIGLWAGSAILVLAVAGLAVIIMAQIPATSQAVKPITQYLPPRLAERIALDGLLGALGGTLVGCCR